MEEKRSVIWVGVLGLLVLGGTLFLAGNLFEGFEFGGDVNTEVSQPVELGKPRYAQNRPDHYAGDQSGLGFTGLVLDLLRQKLEGIGVLDKEALLRFKDDEGYLAFLNRAKKSGLRVIDRMDQFRAVRVGYDDLNSLVDDYKSNRDDYGEVGSNYQVRIPGIPENRPAQIETPFGRAALSWLGIQGDTSLWGTGVMIAILDSGIEGHETFAEGRVRVIDLSESVDSGATADGGATSGAFGHGTAVASIAAGNDPSMLGVAPAAEILDIRITGADGFSDSFTLARAITEAVDAGADIVNISLGSYGDSSLVRDAVAYATEKGSVIVAAAGNDTYSELSFPARYEDVVSVGAVDAEGQQLSFSNSGEGLDLTAPGLEVTAAWPSETLDGLVSFTGTSASTPFVAGSIAAVMSEFPGTTATEAAQLLETYSNEAGAPGADRAFGDGILDVGRAVQSTTTGIEDVAVASHFVDLNNVPEGEVAKMQVVVENRGTTTLHNVGLVIQSDSTDRSYSITSIPPGEVAVREIPIDTRLGEAQGQLQFSSEVSLPTASDSNPTDNTRTSMLVFPEPEATANAGGETAGGGGI
jgi:subtilisin family serine protease